MTPAHRLSTLALSALALFASTACAQTTPARPTLPPTTVTVQAANPGGVPSKRDYSREPAIIETMDIVYRYAADGTGTKEVTSIVHLQDESAVKGWSVLPFAFASSAEHVEIDYIRVRRPDGTVIETPSTDAQEMPAAITREAPFYSDLKEKQVPVRSLRGGDRLEYKVRIVRTHPEAPGHFWGDQNFFVPTSGVVVLEQTVEIHIPKASYAQIWSPKYKSELAETPTERVYTWHSAQLQPIAGLDKSAIRRLVAADPDDDNGKLPHIAWTSFHDWAEVGAWYRGMEGTRMAPDDDIRAKATELTAGKQTPEEKVRAIYAYVGPQIRYIGVAFGVGRYQPHEAAEVLRNQYGDCKDKHTLLAALLSAAGFTSDAALIGAGIRFNEAVPSPGSFNHVITVVELDGKPVWLDATAEVAPYRLLLSVLRDKQALLVPATGVARVERTPKDPPFHTEIDFNAEGSLDEHGISHSQIVMVLRGDDEVPFRAAVRSVSPSQYDELMQNISRGMSFGGTVTHAVFSRPEDTAQPFRITYDYEREKGGDWDNYRIIPQFTPIMLGAVDEKDLPVTPIELGTPHVEVDHAVMKLPTGWSADLPPAIHAKSTFATLDKTYKLEPGKLIADRRVEILQEKIPASEWRAYKKWYTDAGLDGESYVQLVRSRGKSLDISGAKAVDTAIQSPRQAGVDDPKAAALIREVVRLEQQHDNKGALEKLDAAKAINPHQAYLWSNYGYLAMMKGMPSEAIDDFQRELVDHPDEGNVYRLLAQAQIQQQKPQEAIETLKKLVAFTPDDQNATAMLASLYLAQKDYPGAEATLRKILAAKPSDQTTLFLSTALVHTGKKDEATKLLSDIANKSEDPGMLNDAAYTLADDNLDLPLAEKAARHAIAILDQQSILEATNPKPLVRAEMFASVWDTLGWTLFREGKTAEAEPWVRASWAHGLAAEQGYHLGVILEKLGQPAKAMAVYQIALFGERGSNAETVAEANLARQSALRSAGTPNQVPDGKIALQNLRTFKVPGANTLNGWATIEFEISATGPANALIVKDDPKQSNLSIVETSLYRMDFKAGIPPGSKAHIIRRGILSCHAGKPCEFVLLSTRAAISDPN